MASTTSRDRQDGSGESGASRGGSANGGRQGAGRDTRPGATLRGDFGDDSLVGPHGGPIDGGPATPGAPGYQGHPNDTRSPEAVNEIRARQGYLGVDDGFLDKIGHAIAGAFGFDRIDPMNATGRGSTTPSRTGRPDWSLDLLKAALSFGGLLNPSVAALSAGYSLGKIATGFRGLEVNISDDRLGAPRSGPAGSTSSQHSPGVGIDHGGAGPISPPVAARPVLPPKPKPAAPDIAALAAPFAVLLEPTGRGRLPGQPLGADSGTLR